MADREITLSMVTICRTGNDVGSGWRQSFGSFWQTGGSMGLQLQGFRPGHSGFRTFFAIRFKHHKSTR
jgi:hypothetical protein